MGAEDPQVERYYFKYASELAWAFGIAGLSGSERQVLDCIAHYSYRLGMTQGEITTAQFEEWCMKSSSNIYRTIKTLKNKNIIFTIKSDSKSHTTYRINKAFRTWKLLSNMIELLSNLTPITIRADRTLPINTKDIKHKVGSRREQREQSTVNNFEDATKIFDLYSELVASSHRTPKAAKTNIAHWLNSYSKFQLEGAVKNYAAECNRNKTKSEYRKNARNFFGKMKPHLFLDFLPSNYVAPDKPPGWETRGI